MAKSKPEPSSRSKPAKAPKTKSKRNAGLVSVASSRKTKHDRVFLEYPDLRRKVIALGKENEAQTILIEDAGPGMNLIQDLRADPKKGIVNPIPIKPEGSKVDRMVAQSAKIEAGHVDLPKDAPFLATFMMELLAFPNGAHDDQVDSVSHLAATIWSAANEFHPALRRHQTKKFSRLRMQCFAAVTEALTRGNRPTPHWS